MLTDKQIEREEAFCEDWYMTRKMEKTPTYADAIAWADKTMIDKAVEWLENNWREYVFQDGDGIVHFGHWEFDLRKQCKMSRLYYVYRHLCPDGTAYIGVTTNPKRRWEANGCNYCDHPIFRNAIEKFGWKSIEHKILFTCLDKETARIKEKKIALYYQYYGLSLNAGNGHSHSPTKENRKKVSEMRKRTKMSDETKDKIRQANKKRIGTKYFKNRIEL